MTESLERRKGIMPLMQCYLKMASCYWKGGLNVGLRETVVFNFSIQNVGDVKLLLGRHMRWTSGKEGFREERNEGGG